MSDDEFRQPDDGTIDDRLRGAGERLRATAPAADGLAASGAPRRVGDPRRWYFAAGALAAAAAIVALVIVLPGGDETVRQVPTDTGPTTPTATTDPDGDPSPTVPATTPPTTPDDGSTPPTTPADDPLTLIVDETQDDWDGDGGICVTLQLSEPLDDRGLPMCLTGQQIGAAPVAYIRGPEYAYGWQAYTDEEGELVELRSDGGYVAGGADYPEFSDNSCGPPEHDLPPDQWVLVSHCAGGAALYTLPPAAPGGPSAVSVGTVLGPEIQLAVVIDSAEFETAHGSAPIDVVDVAPIDVGGLSVDCVLVVPVGAAQWFETCRFGDEPAWNGLLSYGPEVFVLEQVDEVRLVPIDPSAVLRTHGCSTPAFDVLDAMADPDGILGNLPGLVVTGVACGAADSPFDNPPADQYASASFGAAVLRAGPADGGLVVFERADDGSWTVTDTGTGIEPDVWPLPIPPAEWFSTDTEVLPPFDVTETLRTEVGEAESVEALAAAIETYLRGFHEPEAGDPPSAEVIRGLPTGEFDPQLVVADMRYLDDSVGSGTYTIWITPSSADRPASIERAHITNRCSRGVTESEGVLLCV